MALEPFAEAYPERFLNVGVAEQDMVGVACGLAEAGFLPFCYSIATFASMRGYEFIRSAAVLQRPPIRVVGVGGGFRHGPAGASLPGRDHCRGTPGERWARLPRLRGDRRKPSPVPGRSGGRQWTSDCGDRQRGISTPAPRTRPRLPHHDRAQRARGNVRVSSSPPLISIVLPVHNQADHIERLVRDYVSELQKVPAPYELLLVENASRDESLAVCRRLETELPCVRVVSSEKGGWGRAVRLGLTSVEGDVICYTNSAR